MCKICGDYYEMQPEVPKLAIARSDDHKRFSRKLNKEFKSELLPEKKNHTQCKNTQLLQSNSKHLKPIGGPYKNRIRAHGTHQPTRMANKTSGIGHTIISAKTLRVKELQNQLTDAHYHLNELANENRLLKAVQKRQESALKRYDGINAELPRIINSHHDELKVISTKYKQLKAQHRYTCDMLKGKENEIHALQKENKHLLRLSKDQHLEEREKLQMKVSDLTHQIQQQHETIQLLNRKLTLEEKSLKHQISTEVAKHKETKKKLQETMDKLHNAEKMLESKEKQLYSGRLPVFSKRKKITSQSLTNLQDNNVTSNFTKPVCGIKEFESNLTKNRLPILPGNEIEDYKTSISKPSSTETTGRSETMASLEQVRKFRLPKSAHSRRSSISDRISNHEKNGEVIELKLECQSNFVVTKLRSNSIHNLSDEDRDEDSDVDEEIKNITKGLEKGSIMNKYRINDRLIKGAGYLYNSDNDDDNDGDKYNDKKLKKEDGVIKSPTSRSRNLHARLINGYITPPNMTAEKINLNEEQPKETEKVVKNGESSLSSKKHPDSMPDNLHINNSKDSENPDSEAEEIEEEIAVDPEIVDDKLNFENFPTEIENMQKNACLSIISKSWTELQGRLSEREKNSDEHLFNIQGMMALQKNSPVVDYDASKVINGDGLIEYFNMKKHTDDDFKPLDHKENESDSLVDIEKLQTNDNSLKPVCNGNMNVEVINSNATALDSVTSNNNRTNKIVRSSKSGKSAKDVRNNNSPKENNNTQGSKDLEKKSMNFNKQKLLAAIKAIDDNENAEYLQKKKDYDVATRSQVTENLYRGLPTHTKKRDDIIKDIFGPTKIEAGKLQSGCSKLH